MQYDLRKSVWDAMDACQQIRGFTTGQTLETFQTDLLLRLAIERLFEIIGEALKRVDDADASFADYLPEMGMIIGMRNRIAHGYDNVNDKIIWDTAQEHVPVLLAKLEAWLKANG